jgi:hypothetical protein
MAEYEIKTRCFLMGRQQALKVLAAHFARSGGEGFDEFARALRGEERNELKRLLMALDALPLVRRAVHAWKQGGETVDMLSDVAQDGDIVTWHGQPIGNLLTWYRTVLPQEMQARIAYDSLIDRFLAHIQRRHKVVVLGENDLSMTVSIPVGNVLQLTDGWSSFIQSIFSSDELHKTFVLVLNSVDLGEQFHDLELPIVTTDQAEVLAAYFYTYGSYLKNVVIGNRERKLANLNAQKAELEQLLASESLDSKKRAKAEKELTELPEKISKAQADLEDKHNTHDRAIAEFESLPVSSKQRERIARKAREWFLRPATEKMTGRPDSEAKRFRRIADLTQMNQEKLDPIPQLLAEDFPEWTTRPPGDYVEGTCFVCGGAIEDGKEFKANKFAVPKPSQTLQSASPTNSGERRPTVCATCMAVSTVSPVKLGGDSLIIRLRRYGESTYMAEDILRGYTVGELNVVAGKYLLLPCLERVRGQSMMKRLGGREYALYKLAALFAAEVFESHQAECLFSGEPIRLPNRHLIVLRTFIEVFDAEPNVVAKGVRAKFDTVSEAIRYLEADALNAAVYVMTKTFMGGRRFYDQQTTALEALRKRYAELLHNEGGETLMDKAQILRDVAAVTGLLYPFVQRLQSSLSGEEAKREVAKVIEVVDEPTHFCYGIAQTVGNEVASLWKSPTTHFMFEQAVRLLSEDGVNIDAAETAKQYLKDRYKSDAVLMFTFDDVAKAFCHLATGRYNTPKDWREFAYDAKLSLYARFPEAIPGAKSKKEEKSNA